MGVYRNARILIGQRFGKLTVISDSGFRDGTSIKWYCKCDCGGTTLVRGSNLTQGLTQSCGCNRTGIHRTDLIGQRFHKLLVIGRAEGHRAPSGAVFAQWICLCDCGNVCVKMTHHLKSQSISCGCTRRKHKSES